MFLLDFTDDVCEPVGRIFFPVTFPAIFLKLVVLLDMIQSVCEAVDRGNRQISVITTEALENFTETVKHAGKDRLLT